MSRKRSNWYRYAVYQGTIPVLETNSYSEALAVGRELNLEVRKRLGVLKIGSKIVRGRYTVLYKPTNQLSLL